jgi:hypothetical protein
MRSADTKTGVLHALGRMLDTRTVPVLLHKAIALPDPSVAGVWLVTAPHKKAGKPAIGFIVYLGGYNDPFGNERAEDDFECVD